MDDPFVISVPYTIRLVQWSQQTEPTHYQQTQFSCHSTTALIAPLDKPQRRSYIEVLSPSTEAYDREEKFANYRRLCIPVRQLQTPLLTTHARVGGLRNRSPRV